MKTFEEYLQEVFMGENEYGGVGITKDNCEDMFDSWMQGLDVQEWLDYGIDYGRYCIKQKEITDLREMGDDMFDKFTGKEDWNGLLNKITIIK